MAGFARRFLTCVLFFMPNTTTGLSDSTRPRGLFHPANTTVLRVLMIGGAAFLAAASYILFQYYHSPYWNRVGLAPPQPVFFSHRHHAGELRIDCRFCHASVESSAFAGMPTTQTCLVCHSQVFADTAMLKPVVESLAADKPLQWNKVTRLPDHVYFNHGVHLAKGVSCIACHGELGRMALTAKARPLDMRECLGCHRDPVPRLQSHDELFAALRPSSSAVGEAIPPGENVHPQHLTNCSTCHH